MVHNGYAYYYVTEGGETYSIIQQSHLSRVCSGHCYTDVYSGALYQQQVSTGILGNKNNISLIFNTDGLPVFKSSNFQFWPLFLPINELPYQLRYTCIVYSHSASMLYFYQFARILKENRIFAGLWYGSMKPNMKVFLKPMAQSLKQLHNKGMYACTNCSYIITYRKSYK